MPLKVAQFADAQASANDRLGLVESPVAHHPMPARSVVVRRVSLWASSSRLFELEQILSPDERARMSRYCFEHTRRAFAVSRASLRMILADYCDTAPTALSFEYNAFGKPVLAAPFDHLHFNLSHSGDVAVVAISSDGAVGVDIERMRPVGDALEMARRFFSRGEFEQLRETPDHDRARVFLTLWTRKEACLKVLGCGLSVDPALVVAAAPEMVTVTEHPDGVPGECLRRIWVQDVRVQAGYVAAVAKNHADGSVNLRTFDSLPANL